MAASLIDRLPAGRRSIALQRLSRNANAPGAASKQLGRGQVSFRKRAGEMGIFLIESNVTGALAASVGGVNPPGVATVTIGEAGMTPATVDITTSELDAVTWAGAGAKTVVALGPVQHARRSDRDRVMAACEADTPLAKIVPCGAQGRWVGPDGRVRCSMHHVQEFGHRERLVRVEGYEPPNGAPSPPVRSLEKLPGTHAGLDSLAADRGVDLGDATTVAEKQAVLEAS